MIHIQHGRVYFKFAPKVLLEILIKLIRLVLQDIEVRKNVCEPTETARSIGVPKPQQMCHQRLATFKKSLCGFAVLQGLQGELELRQSFKHEFSQESWFLNTELRHRPRQDIRFVLVRHRALD